MGITISARGVIIDSRVRTANLLQDATSAEPKPGVFAIVHGIRARSGNGTLETRQSLASSDFRLVFKKHSDANQGKHRIAFKKPFIRCSQGKSLPIVTKIIDFRRWHPAQAYTMFASEKVSERNENCRFQPAYVRKVITKKSCQVGEIRREKTLFPEPKFAIAKTRSGK